MNRFHIPGFPNRIPNIDWKTFLPKLKDQKNDDGGLHLVRFHKNMYKLGVELHEDSLMKMFMVSLEGDARYGTKDCHQGVYIPLNTFI